ncbi:hypothetical protein H0H87_003947 [Tephrocybe sp. NHM501043]|nr:hypothetical protein H0H87_003947 [Tephrocybe sp. NHM501043]
MKLSAVSCLLLAISTSAPSTGLKAKQIKNLVTFGDSYTDITWAGDGGVPWPIYARDYVTMHTLTYSYPDRYWSAERNTTQWSNFMKELSLSGNALTKLMLTVLAPTLHGAHIGIFDQHALFSEMYNNPSAYLNGIAPLNVTGTISSCVFKVGQDLGETGDCTTVTDPKEQDSYLWYDELHPSEQADRIVAREIAAVIKGDKRKWTTWLS